MYSAPQNIPPAIMQQCCIAKCCIDKGEPKVFFRTVALALKKVKTNKALALKKVKTNKALALKKVKTNKALALKKVKTNKH